MSDAPMHPLPPVAELARVRADIAGRLKAMGTDWGTVRDRAESAGEYLPERLEHAHGRELQTVADILTRLEAQR